ncbi:Hypothetical protein A7982_01360 [Minicystis rosea]|nr:Hypothetical protein A7982_01360 [Minicystis rosea]
MIAAIVEGLRFRRLPPRGEDDDPLARAWVETDDLEGMIELLAIGGQVGLYGLDGRREDLSLGDRRPRRWLFRLRTPEGKYVRVDVTREGGAAALREQVPAIAPYSAWSAAIEAERDRTVDPIARLLLDLRRIGAADPRWGARWTLPSAWRASEDSIAMRDLLDLLGRDDLRAKAQRAIEEGMPPPGPQGLRITSPDQLEPYRRAHEAWLVSTIRSAVPEPPPLPGSEPEAPHDASPVERTFGYRTAPSAKGHTRAPDQDTMIAAPASATSPWSKVAFGGAIVAVLAILRWLFP